MLGVIPMKKTILWFTFLILFLLITACNNKEPSIEVEVKVSPISKEEYSKVGATMDLIEPKQADFKVLEYTFNMKHSNAVTNRQIETTKYFGKVLESIDDMDRYWSGGGSSQDNPSENFAVYNEKFIFYAKGLSDEDIKHAFRDIKLTVSWNDHQDEKKEIQYTIADLIEFSNE